METVIRCVFFVFKSQQIVEASHFVGGQSLLVAKKGKVKKTLKKEKP